jgi:hypothetical protein
MADWLFDGDNRIIEEPAGSGDTVFNVERDIYSAWKRWAKTTTTAHYPPAFTVEGGLPIGNTGLFTGKTQILINGWKLKPAAHAHQALLQGNIYSDDGVISVAADPGGGNIVALQSAAAQGISTGTPDLSGIESDIDEIKTRLDLNGPKPNTYADDNSQITNADFTLTRTDNGNGTSTVNRTNT